jgi:hypothetical protein
MRFKIGLKHHCLVSVEEIQQNTTGLTAIPKEDFQRYLQQQESWSKCVFGEGYYIEGD